jgi:AICAR transformylase/IMP cyclohydrolase PurH
MKELNGELPYKRKLALAQKVFSHTSRYDTLITGYLAKVIKESSQ